MDYAKHLSRLRLKSPDDLRRCFEQLKGAGEARSIHRRRRVLLAAFRRKTGRHLFNHNAHKSASGEGPESGRRQKAGEAQAWGERERAAEAARAAVEAAISDTPDINPVNASHGDTVKSFQEGWRIRLVRKWGQQDMFEIFHYQTYYATRSTFQAAAACARQALQTSQREAIRRENDIDSNPWLRIR